MKYRIGLDIGIGSVGWAIIEHDLNDEPSRIVDLGVRIFNPAEKPKDGTSLSVDRREARGLRRRLRRRCDRIERAKTYLISTLLDGKADNNINRDIFKLRLDALDVRIANEELYSVILYLIKHRGFKSNRKSETKSGEGGKLTESVTNNTKFIQEKGYRTIGECLFKDEKYFIINSKGQKEYRVRNHPVGIKGSYENCFGREELEKELLLILESQAKLGNDKITAEFKDVIISLFNKQRSFDEGPGEPSKYKANFAVGMDTYFEPNEYRAPKGSFTFEYFNALQKLNHLQIINKGQKDFLSKHQIDELLARLMQGKALTYAQIRKYLNLTDEQTFNGISYYVKVKKGEPKPEFSQVIEKCEKSTFFEFKFSKVVCKCLDKKIDKENQDLIDGIGLILSMRKSDGGRRRAFLLKDDIANRLTSEQREAISNLDDGEIESLLEIDTTKFGNLSYKSMKKISNYLEQGMTYDKACESAGYSFNNAFGNEKGKKLVWAKLQDRLQEITSPVVLRSVSQTIKVVNAIIDKYGSPCAIFVELAREMSKNFNERKKLELQNKERQEKNEKVVAHLKSLGITPSGQDIVRYRLYEEQGGKCAYSGESLDDRLGGFKNIFNNNATQIDHIIPYSKCFDDSYNNKVLVLSSENQKKGNKLPSEYMDKEQFARFEGFVVSTYKDNPRKMQNLLKKKVSEEEYNELNNRALNDTKHSARFIHGILKDFLIFEDSKLSKKPVRAVNGSMTSYLRKLWGINKVRFENDRHHAQDAVVIACCTNSAINLVSKYLQYKDYKEKRKQIPIQIINGEKKYIVEDEVISQSDYDKLFGPKVPKPYDHLVSELNFRLSENARSQEAILNYQKWGYSQEEIEKVKEVFVSRMPTRGVKGPIHEQTLRRLKIEQGKKPMLITKTALQDLSFKNGDIVGYLEENRTSDPLLYNALIKRIKEFEYTKTDGTLDYDVKKAFAEEFRKPKSNGEPGPIVKKVKIGAIANNYVQIGEKTAVDNGKRKRIDIYEKDGKNYIVPIYVSDIYKGVMPRGAITPGKLKDEWLQIDETYRFKFSLYPNDLFYVESRGENINGSYNLNKKPLQLTHGFVYYTGVDITDCRLSFCSLDNSASFRKNGTNLYLEKYVIDVLGNISKVKNEKRMPLNLKHK